MIKRIGVVVLWLLATLGTASITYAAVSQAGGAAGDDPAVPVAAADIAARVSTTTTTTTTTTSPVSSTISEGVTTTTALTPIVTTTTTTTMAMTGSTTTAPTATTSTTAASHTEWKTVDGVGVVGVAVSGDSVSLVSASPVDPYNAEVVEDNDPERVQVKFESESFEHTVTAEVKDGVLEWRVESSSESDDSGD